MRKIKSGFSVGFALSFLLILTTGAYNSGGGCGSSIKTSSRGTASGPGSAPAASGAQPATETSLQAVPLNPQESLKNTGKINLDLPSVGDETSPQGEVDTE